MFNTIILAASDFEQIGTLLKNFLNAWWGPLLTALAACGGILGVVAGVKYWLAHASGDENKIKGAKNFIIGIVIGVAVIFVLAAGIPILVAAFTSWFDAQGV